MWISATRRLVYGKYVIAEDLDKRDERVHALELKMRESPEILSTTERIMIGLVLPDRDGER